MTKEETIHGNRLIAEFMGGKVDDFDRCNPYPKDLPPWSKVVCDFDSLKVGGYRYSLSWDWLMPVVEKIHMNPIVEDIIITPGFTKILMRLGSGGEIVSPCLPFNTSIEECYSAVIQFITCYNQQQISKSK